MATRDVGVIYLYRFAEGESPILRFLESYRKYPAGIEHDFYVVFKGFPDEATLVAGRALFANISFTPIEQDDSGYDIGSYLKAAKIVSNGRLMFLNTFSQILSSDWLRYFDRALSMQKVGLVGATGSWQANTSSYEAAIVNLLRCDWRWQNIRRWPQRLAEHSGLDGDDQPDVHRKKHKRTLRSFVLAPLEYTRRFFEYGRYPNPHIRTNAFMIERKLFLSLKSSAFISKHDVYKFESGRKSLTRQILASGLKPIVVGRNGTMYEISEWRSSSTFWTNEQHNLIIADNRTVGYAQGEQTFRTKLENRAWVHPRQWTTKRSHN
jgi:hypothetical protein